MEPLSYLTITLGESNQLYSANSHTTGLNENKNMGPLQRGIGGWRQFHYELHNLSPQNINVIN
jgi:hypothetical protein